MNGIRRTFSALAMLAIGQLVFGTSGIAQSSASESSGTAVSDSAIVDLAEKEAQRQLRRPVILDLQSLKQKGGWAFLLSRMQDTDGKPLDFTGTRLEGAAKEGVASRAFCAPLRSRNAQWTIVATCLGATDVAWTGWDRKYGAPGEIFELQGAD